MISSFSREGFVAEGANKFILRAEYNRGNGGARLPVLVHEPLLLRGENNASAFVRTEVRGAFVRYGVANDASS